MLAALLFFVHARTPDTIHIDVHGVDRVAYAFAPSQPSTAKPPMIFMFHGHGGSAQTCMQRFYMEKRWPEAVVVYCDGLPVSTAGGDGKGWVLEPTANNRDIQFFDALLPKVLDQYHGDPKRVFAWGFSNGGMFMYTLWTMRAEKFAAFCPSGSAIAVDGIRLSVPKPAFMTISGNDPIVPPDYQEAAWQEIEKADRTAKTGTPYGDGGTYFKGTAPVVLWRYNGGHEFPFESFPKLIEFFKSVSDR